MFARIARLFVIKSKFEAFLVIYALATGAVQRGAAYVEAYPGATGWMFFAACSAAVFMAGGRILDSIERERAEA